MGQLWLLLRHGYSLMRLRYSSSLMSCKSSITIEYAFFFEEATNL